MRREYAAYVEATVVTRGQVSDCHQWPGEDVSDDRTNQSAASPLAVSFFVAVCQKAAWSYRSRCRLGEDPLLDPQRSKALSLLH